TRVGRVLRRWKLDELPQLVNVLRGEMSFVGPRPEVPRYVAMFAEAYQELLAVRPGITDLASLTFRDEETLLARSANAEELYVHEILPRKLALSRAYVRQRSLGLDVRLIARTAAATSAATSSSSSSRRAGACASSIGSCSARSRSRTSSRTRASSSSRATQPTSSSWSGPCREPPPSCTSRVSWAIRRARSTRASRGTRT